MCHSRFKKPLSIFCLSVILLSIAWLAPGFLIYSDIPAESDAVILFVGPSFEDRQQEACRLIAEYRPEFLIVPAYNMVTYVYGAKISRIRQITDAEYTSFKAKKKKDYEVWYEDTHVEVMEAKRLMEANRIRSAIFVSSPYHMRRIKIISDHLLNANQYKIRFVASHEEVATLWPWHVSNEELCWQVSEYAKIAWYLVYWQFARNT